MRRKSERVRDKDKTSEKKVDKNPKKSRRSSRRRKKSSSSSEESETDECDTSYKSCKEDVEEELPSDRNVPTKDKNIKPDHNVKEEESASDGEEREHSTKKHVVVEADKTSLTTEHPKERIVADLGETDAVVENVDKHKESDSKSSVWQVKSADCSGGEINKLKLCIVRPTEVVEPEPRKRKKLSRTSHRESDPGSGESGERPSLDSQDEKSENEKTIAAMPDESKCEVAKVPERKSQSETSEGENADSSGGNHETVNLVNKENLETQDLLANKHRENGKNVEMKKKIDESDGSSMVHCETKAETSPDMAENSNVTSSDSHEHLCGKENTKDPSVVEVSIASEKESVTDLETSDVGAKTSEKEQESTLSSSDLKTSPTDAEDKVTSSKLSNASEAISEELTCKDTSSKPKSVDETNKTKSKSVIDIKATSQKSSDNVPEPLDKSISRESSDSEDERSSYRKSQETKKRSHRLTRHTSDSVRRESDETTSLKRSASKEDTTDKSRDVSLQRASKSAAKHEIPSKESKCKDDSKDSVRLDRKKYSTDKRDVAEKPAKEKISLKRSFSKVSDVSPSSGPTTDVTGQDEENGASHQNNVDSVNSSTEVQPNPTRRRRWGASKSATAVKKTTLSISSDSLKHLIPEVKPLSMSEVHLTEDEEEEEEGEVLDKTEESFEIDLDVKTEKCREDGVSVINELEEKEPFYPLPLAPIPAEAKSSTVTVRKVSIVSTDAAHLQRSPSPARHRLTNILYITNLVRPFTVNQLRELLARTGSIAENGFWIDKIKSKCYVQYETETEAKETRHALHGVRWPVSNPKQLCVDYAKKEDMDLARDLAEGNHIPRKTEPLKVDHIDGWLVGQARDKDREPIVREDRDKERDRERIRGKDRRPIGSIEALEKSRETKMPVSIREWDLGKMDLGSFDDKGFRREERNERERRMRKERSHRSASHDGPGRKIRKKDEEAPAKLLDDLFKKTKVVPCVYWLPLTAEQIVVKEEMRRKHMAEHERRMAEMRKAEKAERERHRVRLQGRSSQRRFDDRDRDKRRHRSPSTSPKK